MRRTLLSAAAVFAASVVVVGGAVQARAAFTAVLDPRPGEASVEQIFEHTYGGNFALVGHDYVNADAGITAVRVDDDLDVTFRGTITGGRVLARFAGYKQSFGLYDGGAYTELFALTGAATRSAGRWARSA